MPKKVRRKSSDVPTFEFDHDYQAEVVHLAIRSGQFLKENRGALRAEAFSDPVHAAIAIMVLDHYDTYGRPPSKGYVLETIRKEINGRAGKMTGTAVRQEFQRIWGMDGINPAHVSKMVRDFSANSLATKVIAEKDDYFEEGKHEEWLRNLSKALAVRNPEPSFVAYNAGLEGRFKSYKDGYHKDGAVPTGLPRLDDWMGGGLGEGELGVIMGLTGSGKSQLLTHFGASAVEEGLHVLHVTLEMSLPMLWRRYDRRLTKLLEKDIARKFKALSKQLRDVNLVCAHYPAYQLTPKALLSAISKRKRPDLLLVDYGAIMASDKGTEQERFRVAEIYAGLRNIANEFRCPVWSAIQVNRTGVSSSQSEGDFITSAQVAESWMAMAHCDVILTWNQTLGEYQDKRGRLYIDKNRELESGLVDTVHADWSMSYVEEM